MVAIFTGSGTGLERGSGNVLGSSGLLGSANFGRGGEQLFLNAATGNLIVQHRDEFLTGRGGDLGIGRTYNSLGNMSDENGDNWRQSTDRAVFDLSGLVNTWGSTVKRRSADGSEISYGWNGSAYVATDGAGAFDTLTYDAGNAWTWTDGDSRFTEVYAAHDTDWRIVSEQDSSGNVIAYSYTGDYLTQIATADGGVIQYTWSGDDITSIVASSQGTTLTRTRYSYDGSGRLSTVTVDLSPEDGSVADGQVYTTTYSYEGASLLVSNIAQSDGSSVTLQYDASQRIIAIIEKVDDATTRTSSLTYGSGYTTITDAAGQTTRLDYGTDDSFAAPLATWGSTNLIQEPVALNGRTATRYTVLAEGVSAGVSQGFSAAAGETIGFALTLQAGDGYTSQDFGLYGDVDGWSTNDVSSARIVSGPGQIQQLGGGLWRVVGLSGSEATRVQITRIFKQAQAGSARFYVDNPGGFRAGASLIAADPVLMRSMTAADLGQMDIGTWSTIDLDTQAAGTLDGSPAYRFTVSGDFERPTASAGFMAQAGETYTFTISLQAGNNVLNTHGLGIYGAQSGWQSGMQSIRIVSGPGAILQSGSAFGIELLSTTETTRIEIVRRFDRTEYAEVRLLPDNFFGPSGRNWVIAGAPLITRRLPESVNPGQLLRITAPPASASSAPQIVQFGYDPSGNLASVTDAAGQGTRYVYDGAGNVLSLTDRLGSTITRTYNAANRILTETRVGSDQNSSGAAHTTRYVYDSLDRLVYVVSPEGRVTRSEYNATGQLYLVSDFPDHLYPSGGLPAGTALTQAQLDGWCANLPETASAEITQIFYDARGNMTQRLRASQNDSYALLNPTGGYSDERFTYDAAGQLVNRYVVGNDAETFVYDGLGRIVASTNVNGGTTSFVFNDAATQTVVTLANGLVQTSTYSKTGELVSFAESGAHTTVGTASYKYDQLGRVRMMTDASGIKSYYLYDKVGRKIADINESGWVAEYRYDANDRLVATARYFNGVNGGSATMALLADPLSDVEMSAIRPAAHNSDIWTWTVYDKEGRVIEAIDGDGSVTSYGYDQSGQLGSILRYPNKFSTAQIESFKTKAPATFVRPSWTTPDTIARNFYDKDGNLIGVLDGEGYLSQFVYDGAGRKVQELAWANPTNAADRASGSFQTLVNSVGTHALDRTVRYVYDGQGRLRFQIDSLFHVTEFGYGSGVEAHGPVRQTIEYAASILAPSNYTYAAVKSAVAGFAGHADNRLSFDVYDDAGRLAYSIDAGGGVVGYRYDTMGQLIRKIEYANPRGTGTLPTKGEMDSWVATYPSVDDRITRYYHNARGELRFTVDAEGYVTRTDYDAEGRTAYSARWDQAVTATDSSTLSSVAASVTGIYAATSWTYDDAGRLATVTDPEGSVRHFYYYGNGKLAHDYIAEGQPDQSRTMFTYDQAGRLAARHDGYEGAPGFALTTFAYDGLGNLISTTDANNHTTSWTYDRLGRRLSETNAANGVTTYEYNGFGDLVRTVDARLNSTWNYYDKRGRLEKTRDAEDYVTQTAYTVFGEVASVTRRYERAANPASVTAPPAVSANAKDATTSFVYDKLGRIKTTDAEGYAETNVYNAFGDVTQTQSKLGLITDFKYNRRGLVESEYVNAPVYDAAGNQVAAGYYRNKFEYHANGQVKRQIEADGLTERRDTLFTYDKAGRLTLKEGTPVAVDQAGSLVTPTEHYAYDKRGNLIETWDAAGGHAWYWYDDLDRKVAEIVEVTATKGTYRAYGYDDGGNLKSSKVYSGWASLPASAGGTWPAPPVGEYRETIFNYDNIDRLLSSSTIGRLADGSIVPQTIGYWQNGSYVYTTDTLTTYYQYDATGNVVKTTDPAGAVVYSYYDRLGRKTDEVDALGYATSWVRDAEGNVLTERRYSSVASGVGTSGYTAPTQTASDRVTSFEYDKMGRRRKEKRHDVVAWTLNTANGQLDLRTGTSAISIIEYLYNALGQVTQKIEATGDTTTYTYDSAGRLTKETRAAFGESGGSSVNPTIRYHYNGLDLLVHTRQGREALAADDRITRNSYVAGRLTSVVDAEENVRNYIYDVAGRKTGEYYSRDLGNGTFASEGLGFEYDLAGNLTRQSVNTIANGVWTKVSDTTSTFNAYGEVITRGTNGGAQEQFAYDGAGRLSRTNSGDGVWRHFVYDAAGRQTMVLESEGMDLSGLSQAQAYNNASSDGVNTTVTVYDKRGQATSTIRRLRETAVNGIRQDIAIDRGYNAFGEMLWEEDAYDRRTDYGYNNMGRVTQIQRPSVTVTAENGTQSSIRPTEKLFYDISGRLVGTQDANSVQTETLTGIPGYKTTRQLLAGTGYGDGEALVVREWHPDGGIGTNGYNAFGDLVDTADELNRHTLMAYDKLGRLEQVTRPGGLDEYYSYDLLGNRIGHWDEVTGYAARERTEYDALGRVTKQVAFGGDATVTSYVWEAGAGANGLGAAPGAWTTRTTFANGRQSGDQTDLFGHLIASTDMGGRQTLYTYDRAGRMLQKVSGTETASYVWLNNGQVGTVTTVDGNVPTTQSSTYDKSGNKLTEYTTRDGVVIQNATATYDALNRLVTWSEAGNTALPAASMTYGYDANSNVRRMQSSFRYLDQNGAVYNFVATQDHWYLYDSMNRMTTSQGSLSGGEIVGGTQVIYDAAGQRMSVTTLSGGLVWTGWKGTYKTNSSWIIYQDYPGDFQDDGYIWTQTGRTTYTGKAIESYTYTADGQLATVSVAAEGVSVEWGNFTPTGIFGSPVLRASYGYDPQGRLASQVDYENATTVAYSRTAIVYDAAGRVASETVAAHQANPNSTAFTTTTTYTTYGYGVGTAGYALGAVVTIDADTWQGGSDSAVPDTRTTYGYSWFDGAVQSSIQYRPDMGNSTSYDTSFGLTASGQVGSASIADGRPRGVAFTLDAYGQALRRVEADNNPSLGDPHQLWYRFNGRQLGTIGNDGLEDGDYAGSIAARQTKQGTGPFRNGQDYGGGFARFGEAYVPYTSHAQGAGGGSYSAEGGETLSQLAAQIWGDASLWYLLAEANGMAGDASLVQGQAITIPQGVTRNSNTAATFKPFDPAETLGNLNPTTPKPQKKAKNCGAFGAIIMIAVAVAVTAILRVPVTNLIAFGTTAPVAGATAGVAAGIAGGAVAGAAGSIASQGFGVAAGIQDKFSWKGVALAGISGGIAGGLSQFGALAKAGDISGTLGKVGKFLGGTGVLGGAASSITGNLVSQGLGLAVGLQSKFDFAGVAVAGVIGGASAAAGGALAGKSGLFGIHAGLGSNANAALSGTASGLAGAAARSLIEGTDFGDNLMAALPDVIGATIGRAVADGIASGGRNGKPIDLLAEVKSSSYDRMPDAVMAPGPATGDMNYVGEQPTSAGADPGADIVVTGKRSIDSGHAGGASAFFLQAAYTQTTQTAPAGNVAVQRLSGGRLKIGNGIYAANAILEAARAYAEKSQVKEVIDRFGLNAEDALDVLSASSYVWGSYNLPLISREVQFSGATNDAASQALMRMTMVDPSIFINALGGSSYDQMIVSAVAAGSAAGATSRARPKGVEPALQTSSTAARAAVAANLLSGKWQVHHLIPAEVWGANAGLARLARQQGWNQDGPSNLIALPADAAAQASTALVLPIHNGFHPRYNVAAGIEVQTYIARAGGRLNAYQARGIMELVSARQRVGILTGQWNPRVN